MTPVLQQPMNISSAQIIAAVQAMDERTRQEFLEDLLAATSPDYLDSIRQARNDYREGRIYSHEDIFAAQ
uniref:Uncharacterized protein n=1 Tax=Candidatus Kentrum sp. SD TaxID=2126332 RepID=A0A450YRN9_9GAMM|nr:MAG: hypothetical protein BECKSD772F_GA0070984_102323 [Candidatus Kentron sp. SD]VFK44221.1 MAG: hypothetical protein BECKSD772E_GA0070983_10356 [Candidatus Kentron sp. SD]VFK78926.1 MAG: hypothetical protein BECKSD772D_GA0070982_102934 [Candidatus Kentron sp. SD]